MNEQTQAWNVREVPEELVKRIRICAIQENRTVREVIISAARQYLAANTGEEQNA